MKKISMPFDEYQDELRLAKEEGKAEVEKSYQKWLLGLCNSYMKTMDHSKLLEALMVHVQYDQFGEKADTGLKGYFTIG